jgi:ubiquitin C-terminal hydrolase
LDGLLCAADTYAKSRQAPNKWHEYNDAHVKEVPVESICTPEAYLLFYRKKGAKFTE